MGGVHPCGVQPAPRRAGVPAIATKLTTRPITAGRASLHIGCLLGRGVAAEPFCSGAVFVVLTRCPGTVPWFRAEPREPNLSRSRPRRTSRTFAQVTILHEFPT